MRRKKYAILPRIYVVEWMPFIFVSSKLMSEGSDVMRIGEALKPLCVCCSSSPCSGVGSDHGKMAAILSNVESSSPLDYPLSPSQNQHQTNSARNHL